MIVIKEMSISEQVKELRDGAEVYNVGGFPEAGKLMNKAAGTIESLSAKLATANEELKRWHTDKINEKIKNPFACTSTICCHNCDHKDEYIEELELTDTERSAEGCGGWIRCKKDNLPDKEVLCCDQCGEMILGYVSEDEESRTGFCAENDNVCMYNCVKWMEKPKP